MIISAFSRLFLVAFVLFSGPVFAAEDEIYTSFLSSAGAGGYDVVAYFTEEQPVEGDSKWSHEYKDAQWYFSSQANLEQFIAAPDKYVPQYGGYCAWAVAQNELASGDPLLWSVVDDRLYLNYNADVQAQWDAARDALIKTADNYWPAVLAR